MPRLKSLWRNVFRRARVERDLDDELTAVHDLLTDEKRRAGASDEEARRLARLELGNVSAIKDTVRDARAGAQLERLARDMRHAARTLRKRPAVPIIMAITLALGSAGLTATFALVNAILLQPLPYPAAGRLAVIKHAAPGLGLAETGLSTGTFLHYRTHARSFETLAVYSETVLNLAVPGAPTERVQVTYAGPDLFETLGVRPQRGRLFTSDDARPGFMNMTWPVPVLLSHQCWDRFFGRDPAIVGGTITLNNRARRVVGVLPEGFAFPKPETDIWMLFLPPARTASFARQFEFGAIARLRPDVSADAATAELRRILPSIEGVYADATAERLAEVRLEPRVVLLAEEATHTVRPFLLLVFGGTAFLMLVTYVNVATMTLVRADERSRELAVRLALGARTVDLLRLLLSEAAVISIAGTAVGLWLATLGLRFVAGFTQLNLPRLSEVRLDGWVLAFTCGLSVVGTLILAGLPSVRRSAKATLPESPRVTDDRSRLRLRNVLVAAQMALALTLAVASALMLQSFWRLARVDPGFDPSGLLTVEVGLPGSRAARHQQIYQQLIERVDAIPGVHAASAASSVPLDAAPHKYPMAIGEAARRTDRPVTITFIMPGYLETMRTPMMSGTASTTERARLPDAVLVSSSFARRYFPGQTPIGRPIRRLEEDGQEVRMFDPAAGAPRAIPPWIVAGVVADIRNESLRLEPTDIVYVPVHDPAIERSIVPTNMTLIVGTDSAAGSIVAAVRQAIRDVDSTVSVGRIRPMDDIVSAAVSAERFLAALLAMAATTALFLGATGVYGVAAAAVRRREQEFAIRSTLGARPGQIAADVLIHSSRFVIAGAAAGLAAALSLTHTLRAFLFEVSAVDPVTVMATTLLVVVVAMSATLLPAHRATRIDPAAALKG
jgi:putative ABC transport system permease protein